MIYKYSMACIVGSFVDNLFIGVLAHSDIIPLWVIMRPYSNNSLQHCSWVGGSGEGQDALTMQFFFLLEDLSEGGG